MLGLVAAASCLFYKNEILFTSTQNDVEKPFREALTGKVKNRILHEFLFCSKIF